MGIAGTENTPGTGGSGATGRIPGERRRRRPTRSGVVLSEKLITDCAMRLIGEHGSEALSVRRLGTALGCDPSAVYRYFHDMDDLLLAIADELIGEALEGFTPGDDWVAALREMARRIRAGYRRHPRAAAMAAYRVTRRANEARAVDTGVGLLRRAGFPDRDAVSLYLAFIDMVLGHAALDAGALALPADRAAADRRSWTDTYQSVDEASHPHLAAVRPHLPQMADSSFELAVDLLLTALSARAPATGGARRGPGAGR